MKRIIIMLTFIIAMASSFIVVRADNVQIYQVMVWQLVTLTKIRGLLHLQR